MCIRDRVRVCDVLAAVERLAPPEFKMEWDNVGLLCGEKKAEVHKVLVALDPFLTVCEEAEEIGADLIVTHHPLIFTAPRSVTDGDSVGRSILFLARHCIAAINAHTNLDQAHGGVNDRLAEVLGLQNVTVLEPEGTDRQGRPWGLLRAGDRPESCLLYTSYLGGVKNMKKLPARCSSSIPARSATRSWRLGSCTSRSSPSSIPTATPTRSTMSSPATMTPSAPSASSLRPWPTPLSKAVRAKR